MSAENSLDLIQSFVVVAEELSFRRGAERMNIDQSALSRRIQKLEELLGFPLFERTTRDVSLTPAGRAFYEKNARFLQDYSSSIEAARLVAEGKTGSLRISYMTFAATGLMPRIVAQYHRKYPYVDVSMNHLGTQAQKIALANDEVDLGFIVGPFDHSEYRNIELRSDPLCVLMSSDHPLAEKQELLPTELQGVDLVFSDPSEAYYQRLDELFSSEGVQLQSRFVSLHTLGAVGLVEAGLGVTIYPRNIGEILSSRVEARPIAHPDFIVQTLLVWRRTNRTRALWNFVQVAQSVSAPCPDR